MRNFIFTLLAEYFFLARPLACTLYNVVCVSRSSCYRLVERGDLVVILKASCSEKNAQCWRHEGLVHAKGLARKKRSATV